MSETYYMHTLDGRPAFFDGDQIVFAAFYGKANPLAASLEQIRSEQKKSRQWRENQGWSDHVKCGHLRFRAPEGQS